MRFVLFVEGHTERSAVPALLKRALDPALSRSVGIQVVRFDGWSHFYKEAAKKARLYLHGPSASQIIAVIGLLDLYGPDFFPPHLQSVREKGEWGEKHIADQVNDPRFRMYFAHHEVEAWLLSDPAIFPADVRPAIQQKAKQAPERVNFNEPPSKLLQRLYSTKLGREYKKLTYGKDLFDRIDPARVAERCPNFQRMIADMLSLAKDAGL